MVKPYFWRNGRGNPNVRIRGKVIPMRDTNGIWHEPDTPEGDRIYWEIRTGKRATSGTSWKALIVSYRKSDRWTGLKPRTRADYEKVMVYIEEKNGAKDMTRLTRKDVIAAQDKNKDRVRFANYIPQVMSVLCEHAIDKDWIKSNPAKGVRRIKTPDHKKQDHIPWTDWAVKKWRAEASTLPRLIFELGVGSVQRPSDLLGFRWSDYDGDALLLRQNKTDKPLVLPCTTALKAALNGVTDKKGLTILTRPNGQPMTYRYMANLMLNERKRLGLEAYDLHALRYRGVMELAWQGCDDDEIAAYSGHSSKDMIRKYAGEARQIMRARQAREKRQ